MRAEKCQFESRLGQQMQEGRQDRWNLRDQIRNWLNKNKNKFVFDLLANNKYAYQSFLGISRIQERY